jgi:hypothetical protein
MKPGVKIHCMSTPFTKLKTEQLITLLDQKRALYNQMMSDNKEFEQVKLLFVEIRALEQSLTQIKDPTRSGNFAEQ